MAIPRPDNRLPRCGPIWLAMILAAALSMLSSSSPAQTAPGPEAATPATMPAPATVPATVPVGPELVIPMPAQGQSGGGSGGAPTVTAWELAVRLVVVIAMALGAVLVVKRVLPRLGRRSPLGRRRVQVIETTYLGPKKTLHVVQVGSKSYLLAGCGDSVRYMTEVTEALKEPPEP